MMKNSREYMPTFVLITANVAVYAYSSIMSGSLTTSDQFVNSFGQVNSAVLNGEVWRLFTAMFVHADILHIFGNMLFLFIFGLRAEDMFDVKEYLLIYLLSGLAGGLLTLFLWAPDTVSIGASGAIFGIVGAWVIYTLTYSRRSLGQSVMTALIYAFFLFIVSSFQPDVNYLAHFGGLATGLLIGYSLAASRSHPSVRYEHHFPSSWGNWHSMDTRAARVPSIFSVKRVAVNRSSGLRLHKVNVGTDVGGQKGQGRVRTSTFTLCPSFSFSCFRRKTGAMISNTEAS